MTSDQPTSSSDHDGRPLVILLDDDEQCPAACAALRAAGWREVEPSPPGSSSGPASMPPSGATDPAGPGDPIRAASGRDGAAARAGGDGSPTAAAVPPGRGIDPSSSDGHAVGREPAPRGARDGHDYVLATVDGPAGAAAVLAEVIAGRGAVVTPTSARVVWVRFVRALADVAGVHRWSASPLAGLDDIQIGILVALGSGASVRVAARTTGVSARSAHRQLSRARDHLGVTTNAAAAAIVVKAVAELT